MKKIKKLSEKQLHILEVAESLIAEKGFKGTSVREICSRGQYKCCHDLILFRIER